MDLSTIKKNRFFHHLSIWNKIKDLHFACSTPQPPPKGETKVGAPPPKEEICTNSSSQSEESPPLEGAGGWKNVKINIPVISFLLKTLKEPKIILLVLCCQFYGISNAQIETGWTAGISATFGSKIKRIGLRGNVYGYRNFAQMNLETAVYYTWNGWGPDAPRWEGRVSIGALGAWGKSKPERNNPFIQNLQNQTGKPGSFGYAYNIYLDNIGTSQATGTIYIAGRNGRFIFENDMFAWTGQDKFITSRVRLEYRYKNTLFTLRNLLWTGDPEFEKRPPIEDPDYPSMFGYYDMTKCKYCDRSYGILALQVRQWLPYNQTIHMSWGIDSEKVRHIVQNEFTHDMPIYGMKWVMAENPHIPMLDINGEPYLFKEGQQIEPFEWFWEIGLN